MDVGLKILKTTKYGIVGNMSLFLAIIILLQSYWLIAYEEIEKNETIFFFDKILIKFKVLKLKHVFVIRIICINTFSVAIRITLYKKSSLKLMYIKELIF